MLSYLPSQFLTLLRMILAIVGWVSLRLVVKPIERLVSTFLRDVEAQIEGLEVAECV